MGGAEETKWPYTLGMNETGGMNDEEFEKYVLTNLERLYPGVADVTGHIEESF